ncbi:MAG: hypothetical protein ACE5JR_13440 [Gemmatimonadota bacterium]
MRLWDVGAGKLLATLEGLPRFYSVAFTPDGETLVAGGGQDEMSTSRLGRIMLWELNPPH